MTEQMEHIIYFNIWLCQHSQKKYARSLDNQKWFFQLIIHIINLIRVKSNFLGRPETSTAGVTDAFVILSNK